MFVCTYVISNLMPVCVFGDNTTQLKRIVFTVKIVFCGESLCPSVVRSTIIMGYKIYLKD